MFKCLQKFFSFSSECPLIGIDIGTKTIKSVVLSQQNNSFSLTASALIPRKKEELNDENILIQSIKTAAELVDPGVKNIAIALPDTVVLTKLIQLKTLSIR